MLTIAGGILLAVAVLYLLPEILKGLLCLGWVALVLGLVIFVQIAFGA